MATPRDQLQRIEALKVQGLITDGEYHAQRAAVLDRLLEEPPLPQRAFRWGMFGCLGLATAVGIVVFALTALLFVLIATHDDGDGFEQRPDVRVALAAGASASVETTHSAENRVTIMSVLDPAPPHDGLGPPPDGMRRIGVIAEIRYVRDDDALRMEGGDFSTSFTLRGSDGVSRAPEHITAALVFEVPEDVAIERLKFNPNLLFGSILFEAMNPE